LSTQILGHLHCYGMTTGSTIYDVENAICRYFQMTTSIGIIRSVLSNQKYLNGFSVYFL
jgi:hypothetical protein